MDLGPHAAFVWASYGACAIVLLAIIVWLWADGRRHHRTLAGLESRGVRRRSASSKT